MTILQYTHFSFNFKGTVKNSDPTSIDALISDLVITEFESKTPSHVQDLRIL